MCELEISHMGKNNGNPDMVWEKDIDWFKSDLIRNQKYRFSSIS